MERNTCSENRSICDKQARTGVKVSFLCHLCPFLAYEKAEEWAKYEAKNEKSRIVLEKYKGGILNQ